MAKRDHQSLEQPKSIRPASQADFRVYSMPEAYRHGKQPVAESQPVERKKIRPRRDVKAPIEPTSEKKKPVAKATPEKKEEVKKKRSFISLPVIIAGIALLLIIIVGAVIILSPFSFDDSSTQVVEVPEDPIEEPEPDLEPEPEPEPEIIELIQGTDADSDGLSDIEEVLYGSNSRDPDTDDDTYLDGNEVYHLYNPRADSPAEIEDMSFVRRFEDPNIPYTLLYPSRWTVQVSGGDEIIQTLFVVPTTEMIQVTSQPKEAEESLVGWYLAQVPDVNEEELSNITTRQGYAGLVSPDQMTIYLDLGSEVYIVSYLLGDSSQIYFMTTFQMMVNSFEIVIEEDL